MTNEIYLVLERIYMAKRGWYVAMYASRNVGHEFDAIRSRYGVTGSWREFMDAQYLHLTALLNEVTEPLTNES